MLNLVIYFNKWDEKTNAFFGYHNLFLFTMAIMFPEIIQSIQNLGGKHFMPELDIYEILFQHRYALNLMRQLKMYTSTMLDTSFYYLYTMFLLNVCSAPLYISRFRSDNEGLLGKQWKFVTLNKNESTNKLICGWIGNVKGTDNLVLNKV